MQEIMKTIFNFGVKLITLAMAGGRMNRRIWQPILNRRNRNNRLLPVLLIAAGIGAVIFVLRRGLDIRGMWNQFIQPITNLRTSREFKKNETQPNTDQPPLYDGKAVNELDGIENIK